MIRVRKSADVPLSLLHTSAYNGEDVQKQLLEDQHKKCYICEREVEPNYHIEHLDSNNPNRRDWNNLFLSCGYCNERKSNCFDGILNPVNENIENIIEQRIQYDRAAFYSKDNSINVTETIHLLERIFNGKSQRSILRNRHEEVFFDKVITILNDFQRKVSDFLINKTDDTKRVVKEDLSLDSELLGFKYWIIKDNPQLFAVFKDDIEWNKQ